mmetsp:Transcript_80593/g.180372  ORF Transcript_80593/g.180372 Transcript_80593/m.180372 type:complete len:102 (+) Transcript_80593:540-845(+)
MHQHRAAPMAPSRTSGWLQRDDRIAPLQNSDASAQTTTTASSVAMKTEALMHRVVSGNAGDAMNGTNHTASSAVVTIISSVALATAIIRPGRALGNELLTD